MTEEQLGPIAQGTTRWIERWYGSEPRKGSSIITVNHDEIAVIGGDKETHRQVRKVVMAHARTLEALDTERTRADKAEQRERELLDLLQFAYDTLYEINPSNYDHDEVCRLNDASVEVISAIKPVLPQPEPDPQTRKFRLGDRLTKIKGSSWTGRVVGFYSTSLTPIGYAIESENEPGSVQIFPQAALSIVKGES